VDRVPAGRLVVVGLVAGVSAGLFGVGGGLVIVPGLVAFCHRDQREAVATSMLAIAPLAVTAAIGYAAHGAVDLLLAAPLALGSVAGALIGTALLRRSSLRLLRLLFVAATLAAAARLLLDPGLPSGVVSHDPWLLAALVPVGIVVGLVSGLTGIGGGAIMVPVLQLGYAASSALAKGTSLLVILPTSIVGGWRHRRAGLGSVRDATWIGLVGAGTAAAAAAVSVRLPGTLSDVLFGCFLVLVSFRMLWTEFRP
jgi:uncharacterized membrane protein YfcA